MLPYAILVGSSNSSRLTEEEIETLFDYAFEMHDHYASHPQSVIFWHRQENDGCYWKHVN